MSHYTEEVSNGITYYNIQQHDASTLIEVRDAIAHAITVTPNCFRVIIRTNLMVATPSQFTQVLNNLEVFGKIPRTGAGYKIALVIEGDVASLFHKAEEMWESGGIGGKLGAVFLTVLNIADVGANFESLQDNAISKNEYVSVFELVEKAEKWVNT